MSTFGFASQEVTAKHRDTGAVTTVLVSAQITECPYLVITPGIVHDEDGRPEFAGVLTLTHTLTGKSLVHSNHVSGLLKLAGELRQFDWNFTTREQFNSPENSPMRDAVRLAIREWEIDQGFSGDVSLWGDDEEKVAARNARPADTMLREQLDWWPAQYKSIRERNLFEENKAAWSEAISCSVNGYGMTYLLAVLMRIDPTVADVAARSLTADYDAGDTMGEWIFQWKQEIDAGKVPTLYGIPTADPLAAFGGE